MKSKEKWHEKGFEEMSVSDKMELIDNYFGCIWEFYSYAKRGKKSACMDMAEVLLDSFAIAVLSGETLNEIEKEAKKLTKRRFSAERIDEIIDAKA